MQKRDHDLDEGLVVDVAVGDAEGLDELVDLGAQTGAAGVVVRGHEAHHHGPELLALDPAVAVGVEQREGLEEHGAVLRLGHEREEVLGRDVLVVLHLRVRLVDDAHELVLAEVPAHGRHQRREVLGPDGPVAVPIQDLERVEELVALVVRELRDEARAVGLLGRVAPLRRPLRRLVERAHDGAHEAQPLHEAQPAGLGVLGRQRARGRLDGRRRRGLRDLGRGFEIVERRRRHLVAPQKVLARLQQVRQPRRVVEGAVGALQRGPLDGHGLDARRGQDRRHARLVRREPPLPKVGPGAQRVRELAVGRAHGVGAEARHARVQTEALGRLEDVALAVDDDEEAAADVALGDDDVAGVVLGDARLRGEVVELRALEGAEERHARHDAARDGDGVARVPGRRDGLERLGDVLAGLARPPRVEIGRAHV